MLAPALSQTTTYPRPSAASTTAVIPSVLGALEDRLAGGSVKKLAQKEHLFLEGDPKTHVYKVEAGTVLIYKILPDSKRQVIVIAFPGDHIGLGSIVSGARPPPGPSPDHALAAAAVQAQGISSSMREAGQRLTSFVSTSVVQASGSTPLSLHVSNSDAITAQFSAPPLQALGRGRRTARSCG